MINESENKDISITPDKATAWIENKLGGKSARVIADERGKGQRTIYRYIADFDDFIRQSEEFQRIAPAIVEMIPGALKTYRSALNNLDKDGNVDAVALKSADNIFKIAGVLFERSKNEHSIVNQSDEDLARQLQELIAANSQNIAGDDCYVADEPEGTVIDDSAGDETPDA